MTSKKHIDKDRQDPSVTTDGAGVHPVWRFLYLLIAPIRGWKRIKNACYTPDYYARNLFFPLLALMAVLCFLKLIYEPAATLTTTLQTAICLFVAGFGGYYAIILLARTFLPVEARVKMDSGFGKVYVMTCLSTLILCIIVLEIIPSLSTVFIVAPIYSTYLMVKGIRFLRVPDSEFTPTIVLLLMLMLGVPMTIYLMLELLMPTA